MTYPDYLINQAAAYVDLEEPLPIDLVMTMAAEGLDVVTIERKLINEREQLNK